LSATLNSKKSGKIIISRKIQFSSAHRYAQSKWSEEKNRDVFGACYNEHGHGHNYVLECFVEGEIDSRTMMVMNVTDLDRLMREATRDFDHHHINHNIPEYRAKKPGELSLIPTTEVLALDLRSRLQKILTAYAPLRLHRLRLYETDDIWVDVIEPSLKALAESDRASKPESQNKPASKEKAPVAVVNNTSRQTLARCVFTQEVKLRCLHHIINPLLNQTENDEIMGICARPHGHEYSVQVSLSGPGLDQNSMLLNRDRLSDVLQLKLVSVFDGRDLNLHFPNTACEAIAFEFYAYLKPFFDADFPLLRFEKIGIQETRKNYFEFIPN
jgi:6-pyruvoyltetrahydropterin/6-carboxytetrahydropterin synthase